MATQRKPVEQCPPSEELAEPCDIAAEMLRRNAHIRYGEDIMIALERFQAAAVDAKHREVFLKVLAWKLGEVAYDAGPAVVGELLRRFGGGLVEATARSVAQREAEEAKAAGRLPQ